VEEKQVSFTRLSEHAWAYTAEGDPNTGVVIGDDAVLVADTQTTPAMAADVIRRIREVTELPLRPAARDRPCAAGVHQPAAALRRGLPRGARRGIAEPRDPLEEHGVRGRTDRRRRAARHRHTGRPLHAGCRLRGGLRWFAFAIA
jgi:hypothetical protein